MDPSPIRRTITVTAPLEQLRLCIEDPSLRKRLAESGLGIEETDRFELRQAPSDRGTEVALLREAPSAFRKKAATTTASKTLRVLKSLIETGEAPSLANNPSGRH